MLQTTKFKPTSKKGWRRISKRAKKKERLRELEKTRLKDPIRLAKKRRIELKQIRKAERRRIKAAWKFIEKSKALTRLSKNLPSKTVQANRKIFLRNFFKILAEKEAKDRAATKANKQSRFWPLLMPITDKVGVDKLKANEQFVYDVHGLWPQFTAQEMEKLLSSAIGKWVKLPDMTMAWRFVRQCMEQVLGVYEPSEEGERPWSTALPGKKGYKKAKRLGREFLNSKVVTVTYGLRDPIAAKKLWSRFKRKYFDMGKKVNGKKSKWIDNAAADSEAPSKKKRVEEGPADSEKAAKKKLKGKKLGSGRDGHDDATLDFAGSQKKRKKSNKERLAKKEKAKRTRLPNLNDDSELRRAKGSDVSYRESGKLGKLWAIVPKNYISLGKLTKLAKKEGIEPVIVRQYISLFRKAEALEVR